MIKRVTGLPDDLIHTDDAQLARVPRGYCWIEGDNARVSLDSNVFGAVRARILLVSRIIGSLCACSNALAMRVRVR
jgi:hypothetical protein